MTTARRAFERCLQMGDAPSAYSPTVGAGTYLARAGWPTCAMRQGDDAAAEALLREVLTTTRASSPRRPARRGCCCSAASRRRGGRRHARARRGGDRGRCFMLAVALYERGAAGVAEAELRRVLELQPGNDHARVALAEALLSQGRLDEASPRPASSMPPDLPEAAARTAAFASLVAGDAAAARPDTAPLPPADRAAYDAWRALPGSRRPRRPPQRRPRCSTALGALLHLEAYDAFGALLPAWEQVELPWRQRGEPLADLYHRRGYLESATEQWIAIVEQAGPTRARCGLSGSPPRAGSTRPPQCSRPSWTSVRDRRAALKSGALRPMRQDEPHGRGAKRSRRNTE